ncbi:MAG: LamG domain-containing protein, partial [Anaerolineae bacterium]|nr:LamG domain-containing protein [Anaerolineae bacterium]
MRVNQIDASSGADYFFIYYNNSNAQDIQDKEGTYDASTRGVWHMNESSGSLDDASSANLDASPTYTPTYAQTGIIGRAIDLDGAASNSDVFQTADNGGMPQNYTFSGWIRPDTTTPTGGFGRSILSSSTPSSSAAYGLWFMAENSNLRLRTYETSSGGTSIITTSNLISNANWHFVTISAVQGGTSRIYINGVQNASGSNDGETTSSAGWVFGDLRPGRFLPFDGLIDEFRMDYTQRSANWVNAQYYSESDQLLTY